MVLAAIEGWHLVQVVDYAVNPDPYEPLLANIVEEFLELAFATTNQWRQDFDLGVFGPAQYRFNNLGGARSFYGAAIVGTMRHTDPGPEQPQVVVNLGDGPYG